jgi:Glucose dehydrogenase C-terminus
VSESVREKKINDESRCRHSREKPILSILPNCPNHQSTRCPTGVASLCKSCAWVLTVQTRKSTQRNTAKNSELLAEIGAHYISTQETTIKAAADKYGPFDLMFEATGFAPIVFEAMEHLGKNGVLILSSVTGGQERSGSG